MITYSFARNFTQTEAETLFLSVNWESGQYPAQLYNALKQSETVLTASLPELHLAGLMTAISDGIMNVYFPYLLVHPEARHKEIGRGLVRLMLAHYRQCYRKILVCPDDRIAFYKSTGLKQAKSQTAMMHCGFPEVE